jgi:osmotically-inducible protein OsmY
LSSYGYDALKKGNAMKRSNVKNDQDMPKVSTRSSSELDEKSEDDAEDAQKLAGLKDKSRLYATGTDNDLAADIQDALGRDASLAEVLDNIDVTVEGELVTLTGKVDTEREIMLAGDIVTVLVGEGNLSNHLSIKNQEE